MEFISQLHFIRPMTLLALPVVAFVLWYLQQISTKDDGWSKICDPHLLDAIKVKTGKRGSQLSWLLWPICLIGLLAIAGPAFQKLPTPVIKNQSALVIALDVSKSMLADDIKPNRLQRAKFKINDILENRKDGQTALLVYSGDAFVVTPLTDDTQTIALMLRAISPEIMPVQGSRVDIALEKSRDLLKQAGYPSGDVLLIADGVNISAAKKIAENLVDDRIRTSVLAVGTKQGAPIPLQTGFVKDRNGNIVIPKLHVSDLKELASSGNGRFAQITGDSADINYLLPSVNDENNKVEEEVMEQDDAFDTEKYIDEGPWLVLLLIPLVALLFRKGMLLGLFFVIGLQTPQSSYAFGFDDLWLNSDQRAAKQLEKGDAKKAYELAASNQWKASAAFKDKDYSRAQELFNDGSADGLYNHGNALAAAGKLEDAIKSYDHALKIRPTDEDTLFNKKQVEEALKKQQEQEQQEKKEQDQENKDQENKDQEDQEKQDSKDQNSKDKDKQQSQEQKDSEGESKESQQNEDDNPEQKKEEKDSSQLSEEEKKKQQEEQKKLEQADKEDKEQQEQQEQQKKMTPEEMAEQAENKEAIEQWLRRIPDDPGGLLRRKFYYQYNQQNKKPDESEDW